MEKLIARWSYWLGIACLVIAVIWKIVNVFWSWHSPIGRHPGTHHGAFDVFARQYFVSCCDDCLNGLRLAQVAEALKEWSKKTNIYKGCPFCRFTTSRLGEMGRAFTTCS